MTKVAFGLHTRATTCIRGPKYAYVSIFMRMQLEFQKHKKCKFFTTMAKVWNESHIV